jgi:hypothetical protein
VPGARRFATTSLPLTVARTREDALRRSIATRRGCHYRDVDHASCKWIVTLHSLKDQDFSGKMLEEALAWYLGW